MKWMDNEKVIWAIIALVIVFFVAQMVRAFIKFVI
jgi:hypothetical protein